MSDAETPSQPPSTASLGLAPGLGRLSGRRILVVGGGQQVVDPETDPVGNGRAMALLFGREGASVAVADRNLASAAETVELVEAEGARALAIEADITSEDDTARMVAQAHAQLGGLDGMVLNVGIGRGGLGLAGTTVADWDAVLATNLRGPMLCCREALGLLEDGSPIVFISSVAGLQSGSRLPAYDSSKAALFGLMRHVAREGARRGVRANTICPGLVDTPLGRRATAGRPSRAATNVPLGRQATAWEVAYAALFLISDESAYVTGQILAVDGGLSGL